MTVLSEICPIERVSIDPRRVRDLAARIGVECAEAAISMAMEDLSRAAERAETARLAGDWDALAAEARVLRRAGRVVGLGPLTRVANDVEALCHCADPPALHATAVRMRRMGEAALFAIWELQGVRV